MRTQEQMMQEKGLGYTWVYDPRAAAYSMDRILTAKEVSEAPSHIVYDRGPILDQGREGACVGFAWAGWYNAGPVVSEKVLRNEDGQTIYRRATDIDEWQNENWQNSSGTSNQAGAKVMRERGALEAFAWASNPEGMKSWLLTRGPVVWTCQWREGMYQTDSSGFLNPTGRVVGGHAIMCLGIDEQGNFVVQNSWGEDFGQGGVCKVTPQTMAYLYSQGHWTACSAVEIGAIPPPPEPKPEPPKPDPKPPEPGVLPSVYLSKVDNRTKDQLRTDHFTVISRDKEKLGVFKGVNAK